MPSNFQSKSSSSHSGAEDRMELYIWGPSWDLPSIDAQSLEIMAYVRFAGAPVQIITCSDPWQSPKGILPFFKHGDKYLYGADEIASHLRQKNYSADFGLSVQEGAQVIAYTQLINESLYPALQFFSFIHEQNFDEVIRPAYGRLLPWFYKVWYPARRLKSKAHKLLEAIYREAEFEPLLFEPEIVIKAQVCIKTLSDKLGDKDFFLQNSGTKLDAMIFSYLASFLKIPWLRCSLRETIKATPNLERFVARVQHRYFSKAYKGPSRIGPGGDNNTSQTESSPSTNSSSTEYPLSHKVLCIGAAAAIMLVYAYRNGMLTRTSSNFRYALEDWE